MSGIISTLFVAALLLAIIALIIRSMVKKKKAGGGCGCGCGGCPMSGTCQSRKR